MPGFVGAQGGRGEARTYVVIAAVLALVPVSNDGDAAAVAGDACVLAKVGRFLLRFLGLLQPQVAELCLDLHAPLRLGLVRGGRQVRHGGLSGWRVNKPENKCCEEASRRRVLRERWRRWRPRLCYSQPCY